MIEDPNNLRQPERNKLSVFYRDFSVLFWSLVRPEADFAAERVKGLLKVQAIFSENCVLHVERESDCGFPELDRPVVRVVLGQANLELQV